jgi:hypothetical protein
MILFPDHRFRDALQAGVVRSSFASDDINGKIQHRVMVKVFQLESAYQFDPSTGHESALTTRQNGLPARDRGIWKEYGGFKDTGIPCAVV